MIEETMSFAEREAARVDAAEERTERFTDRAGRAASESDRLWDAQTIGERFLMGQPILIGHHSEKRARRDQERMWPWRKSICEQRRAGYWAYRAAASEAYERYRKAPGRTLRRIEKLEAERRGVLRERDGVDDKGRQADVWRSEPSAGAPGGADAPSGRVRRRVDVLGGDDQGGGAARLQGVGRADFVKGDFARWRGSWYEVTRVNAKTVTVPHIHAEFDGGAVGAVGGCRVVTRAATAETRHKGSTYTLPYNEVSGRMSAEQMRAALAGEAIPADPRDVTPEPTPEVEAERAAAPDVATEAHPEDVWEGEGGAVPGVVTPAAVVTGARHQADDDTDAETDAPVAVFIASQNSTPARMRVLWWMPRSAAVRLCSDPRTSWKSSSLHWTAGADPDARDADWEFIEDRRPAETAALFAELSVKPLSGEELQERKPGTCHPHRWCTHAWPCGRDLEAWQAEQPKSKNQLRRERQEAARAATAAPAADQPEQVDSAHEHTADWIEMRAHLGSGGTTYHAVCGCGYEVGAWTGQQPGISTGTLRRPLTIVDAPTSTGDSFADRSGFDRTGPWRTVSESVKCAPIKRRPQDERPDFTPTCGELCGHSVICRPRPATAAAPVVADINAEQLPAAGPREQATGCGAAPDETPQAPTRAALAAAPERPALTAAPDVAELDYRVRAALLEAASHSSGKAPECTNAWVLQELIDREWFTARAGIGSITDAGRRAAATLPRERVVIVPCGGKQDKTEVCPAGDMYVGSYHRACRRAAEVLAGDAGRVLILSAKYGLVRLSHYIARYDLRAGDPGTITGEALREQAHKLYATGARVTALGGAEYIRLAREVWPDAETPLNGCRGIGEQLARLAAIYQEDPAPTAALEPAPTQQTARPAHVRPSAEPTLFERDTEEPPAVARPWWGAAARAALPSNGR